MLGSSVFCEGKHPFLAFSAFGQINRCYHQLITICLRFGHDVAIRIDDRGPSNHLAVVFPAGLGYIDAIAGISVASALARQVMVKKGLLLLLRFCPIVLRGICCCVIALLGIAAIRDKAIERCGDGWDLQ